MAGDRYNQLFTTNINCDKGCEVKGQDTIKEGMGKEEGGRLRKTFEGVIFKLIPKE